MRKVLSFILVIMFGFGMLTACSKTEIIVDYVDETALETALNNGEDATGKTVIITADKVVSNTIYGYNIHSGEHLNFISVESPNVENGQKLSIRITKITSFLGSFIIEYEII